MIRIEVVRQLPRDICKHLTKASRDEFTQYGLMNFGAIRAAERAWKVTLDEELLCFACVYRGNIWGTPELGLFVGKAYEHNTIAALRATKELRTLLRSYFPRMKAKVDRGNDMALKFAQFFSFRLVREDNKYYYLEG